MTFTTCNQDCNEVKHSDTCRIRRLGPAYLELQEKYNRLLEEKK
jgi:hypothetical protein